MSKPTPKVLQYRTRYALEQARHGKTVIIVLAMVDHAGHIMTELELHRRQPGEVVIRASGRQGLDHTRSGGSIRFCSANSPASFRGLAGVDLFLVDPRVATTTELEQNMQLGCYHADDSLGKIIRPGDQITIGQAAGARP